MEILFILPGFIVAIIVVVLYEGELRVPKNDIHFYIASDKRDNRAWLYMGKPIRNKTFGFWEAPYRIICASYDFEKIGLNEKDFDNLKWKDEPVEVYLNLKD